HSLPDGTVIGIAKPELIQNGRRNRMVPGKIPHAGIVTAVVPGSITGRESLRYKVGLGFGDVAGEPDRILVADAMIYADEVTVDVGIVLDIYGEIVYGASDSGACLVRQNHPLNEGLRSGIDAAGRDAIVRKRQLGQWIDHRGQARVVPGSHRGGRHA